MFGFSAVGWAQINHAGHLFVLLVVHSLSKMALMFDFGSLQAPTLQHMTQVGLEHYGHQQA
jgi:hypothetical protein